MKFNKENSLRFLLIVSLLVINSSAAIADNANSEDTVNNNKEVVGTYNSGDLEVQPDQQLLMPINTPNSRTNNVEEMRNYYQNLQSSSPERNKQDQQPISPAVEHSQSGDILQDMPAVHIKEITFGKSNIFSESELNEFAAVVKNKSNTAADLNNLVNSINISYRQKGYVTAKAYLPPQKLEGGVVKIEFIEGKVGKIVIKNNKFTRKAYIQDKLEQEPGQLFKLHVLESDLAKFNLNNDNIKLNAKIKAGEEFGTTDVILNAQEKFPLHLVPSFDNFGRSTVGVLRGGVAASLDSVLGYQDRLTTGTNLGRSSVSTFADYNFPIFNKGTRIGGTYSYSNIAITSGPYREYDITGNTFVYSAYLTHPWISTPRLNLSSNIAFNFKKSTTAISDANSTRLNDKTLVTGISGRYYYKKGVIFSSHNFTSGLTHNKIYENTNGFFKYDGSLTAVHNFKYGITSIFKANTQLSPNKLESLEQFQIGGVSTVRGYSEGLLVGNKGYLFSEELLFPIPILPKKVFNYKLRDNVKFAAFVDHGGAFPYKGEGVSIKSTDYLTSAGLGLRITLTKYLTSRLYWGFGLNNREDNQPTARFHFDLVSFPL